MVGLFVGDGTDRVWSGAAGDPGPERAGDPRD